MDPEIATLLASGAASLVNAASTAAGGGLWDLVKPKLAKLFGRGDAAREAVTVRRLNTTAAVLQQASDDDRDQVWAQQRATWQTRLEDFVEEDDGAVAQLRTLLEELEAMPAAPTVYTQNNTAHHGGQAFGTQGPGSRVIVHQAPPSPSTPPEKAD